jgi:hypothetical protein
MEKKLLRTRNARSRSAGKGTKAHVRRTARTATSRTSGSRKSASRKSRSHKSRSHKARGQRWSRQVTEHSDALTLDKGVFALRDPKRIAASLKSSALRSKRRKSDPFRSALSMLTFYINRAGKNLSAARKKTLVRAKDELRKEFGRE